MRKCTKRWLLPVCAAAMTLAAGFSSLAAETVKVTVPNVKGGILRVHYHDGETDTYLPVGKASEVPKGVVLDVKTIGCDYELSNEEYISAFPFSVSVNEKPLEINGRYNQSWKIDADSDLEFDAVFKGMLQKEQTVSRDFLCFKNTGGWYSDTTGMYGAGTLPDKQLTIYM